jgi:glycerol-3-phosphate acyltransferase PlsX
MDRQCAIAVDAMGGDFGPEVVVPGILAALREGAGCAVALYGEEQAVATALANAGGAEGLPVSVVPCTQDIAMGESPANAVRNRPDSPIVKAMRDHREGKVDAVVSAGSTGAMVAASLIVLGRVAGCERPAIATPIPTLAGVSILVDGGANVQCTPEMLLSFARMGSAYYRAMNGVAKPSVGLLNIGEEPGKGNELTIAAHALLRGSDLAFAGNLESNNLLTGVCDVVVTDGFTGNITLKLVEGLSQFLGGLARADALEPVERESLRTLGGLLQRRFNYEVYGGAPLLGVAGVPMICHGRSTSRAFKYAVRVAERQVAAQVPRELERALSQEKA